MTIEVAVITATGATAGSGWKPAARLTTRRGVEVAEMAVPVGLVED